MAAVRPCYTPPQSNEKLRLVQVHVFFRHGDRSPTPQLGKTDPSLWNQRLQDVPPLMAPRQYHFQERPFGFLTKKGAEQTTSLGAWLREAYLEDLRAPLDDPSSFIKARTTNFLRTHMSAWFVLEGLLGSSEAAASVHVGMRDEKDENLYHNDHCARLAKIWRALWMSKRKAEVLPDGSVQETGWCTSFENIRLAYSKHLDLPPEKRFPWVVAADAAQCAVCHGDDLPEDLTKEKIQEIRGNLADDYVSTFQDKEVCELSMGRLLREVVEAMQLRGPTSVYLYSGHDATIVPLSVSLGVPWKGWPSYAASICIELWSSLDGNQHFVRVLYDGKEVSLPVGLPGIEHTWLQEQQHQEGSCKVLPTFEEFCTLAGWSMISEAEYNLKCSCDC